MTFVAKRIFTSPANPSAAVYVLPVNAENVYTVQAT
jgi:hypothetical protein